MNRRLKNAAVAGAALALGIASFFIVRDAKASPKPTKTPEGGRRWGPKRGGGGTGGGEASPNRDPSFDPFGSSVWVSPDCTEIEEGARFWPDPPEVDRNPWLTDLNRYQFDPQQAQGRACVVNTVYLERAPETCTGLDYVDSRIVDEGITDPITIAQQIAAEVAPLCWDSPPDMWTPAFSAWYNSLVDRLTDYVEEKLMWLNDQGYGNYSEVPGA